MKKKILTITFNHAYNFGSVLQAYALQEFVKKIFNDEVDYKIIDYYPEIQKEYYRIFKKNLSLKNFLKNLLSLFYYSKIKRRKEKFEKFINSRCRVTRTYSNRNELLANIPEADVYISGSDQLWNVLKGDMSLIGPRPLVDGELDAHNGNHAVYESIRPGITGWWAANGRSATTYKKRLELEYFYCRNCNIILDIKCIFKTIAAVLFEKGAK